MFSKILIIDNETRFSDTLQKKIRSKHDVEVDVISNFESINDDIYSYDLYIIRLDDRLDEVIQKLSRDDKFIIITTNRDTKEVRKKILSYHVSDYVITHSNISQEFICKIIKRLENNKTKTILTVDDSKVVLTQISTLLNTQNLHFIQCHNGQEAWEYLKDPDSKKIDLVVTDYEMPKMNGYELVKNIRAEYSFEELPVLVLSGTEDTYMISRFLKVGANDYITKPFINEEFIGRVTNALLIVDMFNEIKEMAMTDHLTALHNRSYFYDVGVKVLEIANRAKHPSAIAMIDIDNFKSINDTYGHEVGDQALIHIANTIKKALRRSDVFVRFGGEEFVILLPNCSHEQALKVTSKVCSVVEKSELSLEDGEKLKITISIGVTSKLQDVDKMIEQADKYMYTAKQNGKNRVYSEE